MSQTPMRGFRLSPQQRRLWPWQRDGRLVPGQVVLHLEGAIDPAALERCLEAALARHAILRTWYASTPGRKWPLQMVQPAGGVPLRQIPIADRRDLERHLEEEARAPFALTGGAMVRAALLSVSPSSAWWVLTLPAVATDITSLRALAEELVWDLAGESVPAPALSYTQFAEWQGQLEMAADAAANEPFWRRRLSLRPANLKLPHERSARLKSNRRGHHQLVVPRGVAAVLTSAAEAAGTTTAVLVHAVWQTLLAWLAGQDEVTTGWIAEGRGLPVLAGLQGRCVRLLPMSLRVDRAMSLERLAARAAMEARECLGREDDAGLDSLLAAEGGDGGEPPLPVLFEATGSTWRREAAGLAVELVMVRGAEEPCHLKLTLSEVADGFSLELSQALERLELAAGKRLMARLGALLSLLCGEPSRLVRRADLVSPEERGLLLDELGGTSLRAGDEGCFHTLVRAAWERAGDAVVMVADTEHLSAAEAGRRVTALAAELSSLGLATDQPVILLLERSLPAVVGLLAILEAGGAYVPLEPGLPDERLRALVELTGARFAVTTAAHARRLETSGLGLVLTDAPRAGFAVTPASRRAPPLLRCAPVAPANLAYVLFTSGSTGLPKAVGVEHRQVVHYLRAVQERLQLPATARYGLVSTLSADLGNTTLLPALAQGGCLLLATADEAADPLQFRTFVSEQAVDVLKIVPSHLKAVLRGGERGEGLPRRVLVLGGETFETELAEDLLRLQPALALFNHYGPTETTVGAIAGRVELEADPGATSIPLGRPLPGCQAVLVDLGLELAPFGTTAELLLAGGGVARGYLGRAADTAARFVPHPFATRPGERVYRSGDRAAWLENGKLLFLGRVDHQVKVRGFRVELGEIEEVLRGLPEVGEVVVVFSTAEGEGRLVAYLVGADGGPLDLALIRRQLASRLPDHMLPRHLVPMKALPLNANGKVDRRALPAPEEVSTELERIFVDPKSTVEALIAEIWAEVLRLERVGVTEDFFALGGHSLLAMQVASRLREALRVEVPVRVVFQAATVEQMARLLIQNEPRPGHVEKVAELVMKVRAMSAEEAKQALAVSAAPSEIEQQ